MKSSFIKIPLSFLSGNTAVCRAVLSQSTTLKERTGAFANIAMWQAVGFAFGPGTFQFYIYHQKLATWINKSTYVSVFISIFYLPIICLMSNVQRILPGYSAQRY